MSEPMHDVAPYPSKRDITCEQIRDLVIYDPSTGEMRIRKTGKLVSNFDKNGYNRLSIKGQYYFCHRIAWIYITGDWPKLYVDHINGVVDDNRIVNLRQATYTQNCQNRVVKRRCSSTLRGVTWHKQLKKWQAQIQVGGSCNHLGLFDDEQTAHEVYVVELRKHAGEFACTERTRLEGEKNEREVAP